MPTINDLRQQAATIKNATQVGENTATRVGTTFETIADLLEQQGVGQGVPSVDLSQLNTLRTPADQTTANPTIYNVTTLHNLSSTTIKVGTLFIFSDGGRAVVTQILLSNYQVDGGGNISSPNTSQITMYYRMFNIVQETWSAWTLYAGGGGGGTIDPYPVSGSSNAVESNGVFEGLQKAAPEVNINDIDDLDDFVDMQTGVASTYTIKAYHNLSSTWLRVGVLMVFANQTQNTLTQICISNCMIDGGGNLIPNYTTNAMNVFYRFKQFSGVPPEGMTIGVWTTWAKFGDSGYQPDNEDIDLNASDQLQFANKAYDVSAFSGLGRVYLRKNIVTSGGVDKNVLTQAMVNTANTIYHIQYDYDLNGQTITLPAGCVLEFDGGSVKNGTITGNDTIILDAEHQIFNGCTISGTWDVPVIKSVWFNVDANTLNNILALNSTKSTDIFIDANLTAYPTAFGGLDILSNTFLHLSGTITKDTSTDQTYSVFGINNAENVRVFGGKVKGNRPSVSHTSEYGFGFQISGSKNIYISTEIADTTGDGIYIIDSQRIVVENTKFADNGRNGISVISGESISVNNCHFKDIKYKSPQAGIDLEPNSDSQLISDIVVNNCIFEDCQQSLCGSAVHGTVKNVSWLNSKVTASSSIKTLFLSNGFEYLKISNCIIEGTSTASYPIAISSAEKAIIENCHILIDKPFNLTNTNVFFLNNVITSTDKALTAAKSMTLIRNKITAAGSIPAINIYAVGNEFSVTSLGMASKAENVYFEDNKCVFVSQYQCINLPNSKNVRIINNTFDLTGERNLIVFNGGDDIIFKHNIIDVKSKQKLFEVIGCTNVSIDDNVMTFVSGYASVIYTGVNLLTSKSNRKGDRWFFDSIGKYAVFNGKKWIDDNNFTAALGKGATANRPTFTELYASDAGFQYFDTDLQKPLFVKAVIGSNVITKTSIAKNVVDDVYYGVNVANTLTEGANYQYVTSYHTSRTFKAAFRKTNNLAYEDSDEILIAETKLADSLAIKAPDPAVYPYVFFCNLAYDTQMVTAWIKAVDMSWVDATGTAI